MRCSIGIMYQEERGCELRVGNYPVCDDLSLEDAAAIADAFGGTVAARTKEEAVSVLRVWILRQNERERARRQRVQRQTSFAVDWKKEGF
jgi:hypothetical protein